MTMHEYTTHDDLPRDLPSELPRDLRGLAAQLHSLGELERLAAADAVMRTTMRTAHLLREPPASEPAGRLRALWLWIAAPAVVTAAALLGVLMFNPPSPVTVPAGSDQGLAADIESDIDAWMALDSMWRSDSFETNLAAISIDAAGITTTTTTDSLDSLSDFGAGL
jgi:hypothetical protein